MADVARGITDWVRHYNPEGPHARRNYEPMGHREPSVVRGDCTFCKCRFRLRRELGASDNRLPLHLYEPQDIPMENWPAGDYCYGSGKQAENVETTWE